MIKNYALIGLAILSLILGFLYFRAVKNPKIVKQIVEVEKRVNVDRVVYQDRVIDRKIYVDTGGHVVTTEHIVEKPVIHETVNTVEKEKEVTKYAVYPVEIGIGGSYDLRDNKFYLIDHAEGSYFWINNNIGSSINYNWRMNLLSADYLRIRF